MSLINDMLKNLEKSPRPYIQAEKVLEGLSPNFTREFNKNPYQYIIIICLMSIFILMCIYGATHQIKKIVPQVISKRIFVEPKIPTLSSAREFALRDVPLNNNPTLLTGIALQMEHDSTNLRLLLNQDSLYRLSANPDTNEVTIIFDNTQLLAALPKIDFAGSGIDNIKAFSDENKNLKLVLSLNAKAEVKKIDLNEDGKAPELLLDINYSNLALTDKASTPTIPVSIKNPVVEEASEEQYQNALRLTAAGQNHRATQILRMLLIQFPENIKARETLIGLLMNNGDRDAAAKMINEGLELQADYAPLVQLKARMLVDEGKNTAALRLLEQSAPSLQSNPDYHAFIAALYQRSGKYTLAAELYKQLLTLNPNNGKWWLGLGVTLDSMGNRQQAAEAYANAESNDDFNPELKAYLSSRLSNTVS